MARTITPAVRRALGLVTITGRLPTHIHLDTWSAAMALVERASGATYVVTPAALAAAQGDPMAQGHRFLIAQGFELGLGRPSSLKGHWLDYRHADGRTATVYRDGDVKVRAAIAAGAQPPFPLPQSVAQFKPGPRTIAAESE